MTENQSSKDIVSLLQLLETHGHRHLLTDDEIFRLLHAPFLAELSPKEQWQHFKFDRQFGFRLMLIVGGLKLLLLLLAAVSALMMGIYPGDMVGLQNPAAQTGLITLGGSLFVVALFLLRGFVQKIHTYPSLPDFEVLFKQRAEYEQK